jgi:hypothetical protein
MPLSPLSKVPFFPSTTMSLSTPSAQPAQVNPLAQGDGPPQGGLPASLRQKLIGKVPGALSFDSLKAGDVPVPSLRAVAVQARAPRGVTHDEALRVRRAALVQLQTGAQAGSPVAAVAGATLAILDSSGGVGLFRQTEFTDRVLGWVATTGNEQFAATPGVTVADGLKAVFTGLAETRGADPAADAPLTQAALTQAAQLSAPGSFVSSLVQAHDHLARQLVSSQDKAQLAEQALKELTTITSYDVVSGGHGRALRALARHANWALTWTDADRVTLKTAALRTIASMAGPQAKVTFIANDAQRLLAGARSFIDQDFILKSALETIQTATDADF